MSDTKTQEEVNTACDEAYRYYADLPKAEAAFQMSCAIHGWAACQMNSGTDYREVVGFLLNQAKLICEASRLKKGKMQ